MMTWYRPSSVCRTTFSTIRVAANLFPARDPWSFPAFCLSTASVLARHIPPPLSLARSPQGTHAGPRVGGAHQASSIKHRKARVPACPQSWFADPQPLDTSIEFEARSRFCRSGQTQTPRRFCFHASAVACAHRLSMRDRRAGHHATHLSGMTRSAVLPRILEASITLQAVRQAWDL
ncbi:hypothetical protein FA95DRAFT_1024511 [Auriscalpium vulgare]|uniref:Uncharacterized protein n=1 Tax=Auriscalpium vulgare TaxID=40419 RepID=A0ACB8RXU4_9AGAM|nr:hypothetical protein FA95DRAFT_1024511 [Auriscalpium vulgare]